MPLSLRPVDVDDTATLDAYLAQTALVFTAPQPHTPERREAYLPRLRRDRLSAVHDGDQLVGTYRSWDWNLTVPGGSVVTADAISAVTVRPSHRRRGVLTTMIRPDLDDAAARGVPVAVLVASEAPIYGRFGFGAATEAASWELDLAAATIAAQVPRTGEIQVVDPQVLRHVAPAVFEAARCAGATDRSDDWWDRALDVTPWPGEPVRARAAVIHRGPDGTPEGYAVYSWKDKWIDRRCHTVTTVEDLHATTAQAYATLWAYFAELDLVATVRAHDRPVDEALPWLFTDARAARRTATCDFLWVRLLDPAAALSARRYESAGRAVLEVVDPLGHASGRLELMASDDGSAQVDRTDRDAELTLPVDVLSGLYLGAGDLRAATTAGRVTEHVPGAVDRVARLLRTTSAPWTGTWF